MTYAFDNRQAKGTALYARKLTEKLIEDGKLDLFLVHYDEVTDPIYKKANEIIMPKIKLPYGSRFVRQLLFYYKYRNNKFDIIHWFQPRLYPFFWLAPAKKMIVTAHGAADITSLTTKKSRVFSRDVFNFLMIYFNKYLSAIIAVSDFGKKEIVEHYRAVPEKVFTIYNGGSEDFNLMDKDQALVLMKQNYDIDSPFILDISRMEPHKNVGKLVQAYFIFRRKYNIKHKLVIVGNRASEGEKILTMIENSDFKDDIKIIDFVKGEDLNALYSASDLFVFPSLNEGFGLPVVESMASGTAVITSNITALPEMAGEAAVTVSPTDATGLAEAMFSVLSDDKKKQELVERGLKRAREFTWSKTAEATENLYSDVLNNC